MTTTSNYWFGQAGGYQINQSLRFDGTSNKLTRTNPTAGGITNQYTWTFSFWLKRSNVNSGSQPLLGGRTASPYTYCYWNYASSGRFWIGNYNGSSYVPDIRPTNKLWRDPSAWEHFMLVYNTSESTGTDRLKIYSNGVRFVPDSFNNVPGATQLFYSVNNPSNPTIIGHDPVDTGYFNGYMAEVHFVDGQALTPSSFGETDLITGTWIPKKYTGTYGLNGCYLKFDPSATNGIGHDHSGNGNHFTATGFDTTNTTAATYDVMSDTPTNYDDTGNGRGNYCVLTPLGNGSSAAATSGLSNGNLQVSGTITGGFSGSMGIPVGKWYWEVTLETVVALFAGVCNDSRNVAADPGVTISNEFGFYFNPTINYMDGSGNPWSTGSVTNGDIIGIAVDASNFSSIKLWLSKNNTWYSSGGGTSGNPASGTNPIQTITDGKTLYPYCSIRGAVGSSTMHANFGQRSFSYTPPTGFKALNTANLPEPTIKDGGKYFDTKPYTGSGGSQSLTGLGFQPELVWIKARSTASSHGLYDAVRGVGKVLLSNSTSAEQNYGSYGVTSFDAAGFSVNDLPGYGVNDSGVTYAAWCWDAGGTGSSNTAGSITSTVSANASAGFSIATYTGNGTAGATIGHGLGVAPSFIVTKRRDNTSVWNVYHASLGATKVLYLNQTSSQQTDSSVWNNTAPSSTVFTVGTDSNINTNTGTFVAYCFSEVAGYSKFGSYVGNGSSDGPFVFCGFRPAFVMIKVYSGTTDSWFMYDAARDSYNLSYKYLRADLSNAENTDNTNASIDILSNGFKLRHTGANTNGSGNGYIFAAFAELPFKYANAR